MAFLQSRQIRRTDQPGRGSRKQQHNIAGLCGLCPPDYRHRTLMIAILHIEVTRVESEARFQLFARQRTFVRWIEYRPWAKHCHRRWTSTATPARFCCRMKSRYLHWLSLLEQQTVGFALDLLLRRRLLPWRWRVRWRRRFLVHRRQLRRRWRPRLLFGSTDASAPLAFAEGEAGSAPTDGRPAGADGGAGGGGGGWSWTVSLAGGNAPGAERSYSSLFFILVS